MKLSTNCFIKLLLIVFSVLLGCAVGASAQDPETSAKIDANHVIAALPVYNLSGTPVPLKDIRQTFIDRLTRQGVNLLADEALERFIFKYRLRYIGGINKDIAKAFRLETEARAVLITSVELYNEISPPKIALAGRLVSTGAEPQILWMDGIGLAGDDVPGLFELSLIENPRKLVDKAITHLSAALIEFLTDNRQGVENQKRRKKFLPKLTYRSPILDPALQYSVAILPFHNKSQRKYADEIISLHFINHLRAIENFAVIEPGLIRHTLLRSRIIMHDGISLSDADAIFARLHVDLILTGKIFDYQDYQGPSGTPKVNFSAALIERRSREVIWSCTSYNQGDEGVWFFGMGKVNTAHALSDEMVQLAVGTIFE
jgi:TolB-like protein